MLNRLSWRLARTQLVVAAATLGVLALTLGLGELVLRRLDPRYLDRLRGPEVQSLKYGWALRPGFDGVFHGVQTTVNARGYRGRVHPFERTPGRTRIVMLGDSITFGIGVRDSEVFSAILEARNSNFEIVNLGIDAYGTDQELLVLEHEGLRYRPEIVVLNMGIANDVADNYIPEEAPFPKPYFTLEGETLQLHDENVRLSPERVVQYLADRSHLVNRIQALLPEPATPERTRCNRRFVRRVANQLTIRLVLRMAELARQSGATLLVAIHPDETTFDGRYPLVARLSSAFRDAGLEVLDLAECYRAAKLRYSQVASDYNGHLTPLGHAAAADALEPLLLRLTTSATSTRSKAAN